MKAIKKVLIAEDELLIAKVLSLQFERLGYIVECVSEANEVIEKVEKCTPDVIIMDVHLENKGSGIEVGKKLRQMGNKIPIVFATGNSYSNTLEQVKSIENTIVISKPVDFEQLLSVINNIYC